MQERFETFTVLIGDISKSIRKIKTQEMAEFNLKSSHVSCLYYLSKSSLTLTQLSDYSGEDKASVSRSLDYLENQNYITRDQHEKRYNSPIKLTQLGELTARKIAEKIDDILLVGGEGMDETERQNLYKNLFLVRDNLKKITDKYGE